MAAGCKVWVWVSGVRATRGLVGTMGGAVWVRDGVVWFGVVWGGEVSATRVGVGAVRDGVWVRWVWGWSGGDWSGCGDR